MNKKKILDIKISIETITIQYIIVMGLLIRYVEYDFMWNIVLFLLLLLSFGNTKSFSSEVFNNKLNIVLISLLILVIVMNILETGQLNYNFFRNMVEYSKVLCVLLFFIGCSSVNSKRLNTVLIGDFWLFNLFWIVNLIVVGIQITGSGFLIKSTWLESNSYYPDQCAGLFGNSGTHILSLFSVFILIYNQIYVKVSNMNKSKRMCILVYTYLTEVVMLYFSTKNDNFFLYFLLVGSEVLYFGINTRLNRKSFSKRMKNIMRYIIIIVILVLIVVNIPQINKYLSTLLASRFRRLIYFRGDTFGGNERLAIVAYGFEKGNAWKFGLGLGASTWAKGKAFSFQNFGLSSIGSFILLGGIWFYIINCIYFGVVLAKCYTKTKKVDSFLILTIMISVALSIYTRFFTVVPSLIWTGMIFVIISELREYYSNLKIHYTCRGIE